MALTSLSFKYTDDSAKGVGFWIIQKFTRGKSVETVKIRDNPIQISNIKSRIIDTALLKFNMSKLLSSYRICIRGFINWHFRRIILSPATYLIFQKGNRPNYADSDARIYTDIHRGKRLLNCWHTCKQCVLEILANYIFPYVTLIY